MRGSDAALLCPGTAAELPYPADWPLFFYRSGSVIPLNMCESTLPDGYPETLELFAVPLGPGEEHSARDSLIMEDNGLRILSNDSYSCYRCSQRRIDNRTIELRIDLTQKAIDAPAVRALTIAVPKGFPYRLREHNCPANASKTERRTRKRPLQATISLREGQWNFVIEGV